jgi:hypothetical protein
MHSEMRLLNQDQQVANIMREMSQDIPPVFVSTTWSHSERRTRTAGIWERDDEKK